MRHRAHGEAMPSSLARKLLICAAVDGLVIQPLAQKGQRNTTHGKAPPPVKVKYGGAAVSTLARDQLPDISMPNASFEAFGIIGTSLRPSLPILSTMVLTNAVTCQVSSPSHVSPIWSPSPAARKLPRSVAILFML